MKDWTRCSAAICALSVAIGCGGKVQESVPQDEPGAETNETEPATGTQETSVDPPEETCVPSERLVQHVCTHTNNGPYVGVAATGNLDKLPDVSRLHGAFDVNITALPARFRYDASRAGTHIAFTDSEVEWSTIDASGNSHPMSLVAGGTCAGTASGRSFEVEKGQTITLEAVTPPTQFTLFVEHAATFGDDALECPSGE